MPGASRAHIGGRSYLRRGRLRVVEMSADSSAGRLCTGGARAGTGSSAEARTDGAVGGIADVVGEEAMSESGGFC